MTTACVAAPCSSAALASVSACPAEGWWTSGAKSGHWLIIVSAEEIGFGYDVWGFRIGELRDAILNLVPRRPDIVTAAEIALRLNRQSIRTSTAFVRAVRAQLQTLKRDNFIRSSRLGGAQLGWHRL